MRQNGNSFKDISIKKLLLLLCIQLFILSCADITTDPNDNDGDIDTPSAFLVQVANKLLIDSKGRYLSYHSDGGRNYTDYTGRTFVYIKDISIMKAVYRLQNQEYYYGHEIRSGALYTTDEPITNMENISWVGAKKVGDITIDYSASFLNYVVGKTVELCRKYFDDQTGRKYLSKFQPTKNAFEFVQAISTTRAIYENKIGVNVRFMGLKTVGLDLYETNESDNLSDIDWDIANKVGVLE